MLKANSHPMFNKATINIGRHRDMIELSEGPDGDSIRIVISREQEEEYSSMIHRTRDGAEALRRLSPLEYTLARQWADYQRELQATLPTNSEG